MSRKTFKTACDTTFTFHGRNYIVIVVPLCVFVAAVVSVIPTPHHPIYNYGYCMACFHYKYMSHHRVVYVDLCCYYMVFFDIYCSSGRLHHQLQRPRQDRSAG